MNFDSILCKKHGVFRDERGICEFCEAKEVLG